MLPYERGEYLHLRRNCPPHGELAAGGLPIIGNWLRLATLPDASAYHCRVALRELSRHEILQAVAEYDRLGQNRFSLELVRAD